MNSDNAESDMFIFIIVKGEKKIIKKLELTQHMMNNRQPLQQMLLGKVVIYLQKTETRSMSITLY
jgi:hypothetical protein